MSAAAHGPNNAKYESSSVLAELQNTENMTNTSSADEQSHQGPPTPYLSSAPGSPYMLSRNSSFASSDNLHDDFGETPPDKVTFFDIFENLSLPTRIDKWHATLNAQKEKVKKQREILQRTSSHAKDRAVAEWKKRAPTSDEQLAKYRKRMKRSVDDMNKRWNDTVTITLKEKISFISAVLNIFISGYLIGAVPERFYWWFTVQFCYFMPIRYITYKRKGYHYFVADLCYFVNALCMLSIWLFPRSKRLFISTYCLAYGNNAIAIVMWRNSLVFHSLDKVTSLFIHVMPPVMLHCMVHLTPDNFLSTQFPAVYDIKFSPPGSKEHYSLLAMLLWATLPYAIWQIAYHFFITVARADKIAAGRPTSFTWLRKSYAKTWLGKMVMALPDSMQGIAFMFIQYSYALLTIIPCPLWFWYRWASAGFLMFVFSWSVWNGANYYMDVFGVRFKKELEQMKKDVAALQNAGANGGSPYMSGMTPGPTPAYAKAGDYLEAGNISAANAAAAASTTTTTANSGSGHARTPSEILGMEKKPEAGKQDAKRKSSLDKIPMLDEEGNTKAGAKTTGASASSGADKGGLSERKA